MAELFREGQAKFETSDFDGAIEVWERAYSKLPDDPALAPTRALLMANIAQAHVAAHAVDHDLEHLRRADVLFEQYLATLDASDTETRASVEAERNEIAEAIAAVEREQAEREQAERERAAREQAAREQAARDRAASTATTKPLRGPRADDMRPRRYNRRERALSIGGGVTMAFGVALTGAMGAFLWLRDEQERKGRSRAFDPETSGGELLGYRKDSRRFNGLAISTGAAAATLAVIGLGLIGAAEAARARRVRKTALWVAPSFAGAAIGGRF